MFRKKQLLITSALLFSILGFSQGIEFEHGSWKEVLEKAQQSNKPIFIDVYTSWCGPCKKMSKDIFPLTEVGKVYNANFICYQIDAEKGDGIEIAKMYKVRAYPTYLFIKSDGILYSRALGYMEAKVFIEVSKTALADMNNSKPIAEWEKEYLQKKNDTTFIKKYMDNRTKLGLPNATLFDEYLKLIPEKELISDFVVKMYQKESQQMKVNSFAYANLQKNKIKFIPKLFGYVDIYLQIGIMNTVLEAAKFKDEQLLATAIQAYDQSSRNPALPCKDEIYMEYYKRTGESDKYVKHATNFCNNKLMKISPDSIVEKDKRSSQLFDKQLSPEVTAKFDSTQLAEIKKYMANAERNKISNSLNNIAWEVFEKVSDVKTLQDALGWSKRSLELSPNNPMWLDTYANLLYKLDQKEDAIIKEKEALYFLDKTDKNGYKRFEETIRKMNAGEKTWKD